MTCPPRDAFQIGWICALPIEAAAAAEMLDEDFGILEEQDAADSNTYRLGRISKHHVVIACLPQYGTTSATTVANNMLRTFSKSLKIGLMVGVGGGIPSAAHDIRLGDVVISYPQDTCGGVIQYDMGKAVAGGEFERTGALNSPPRALLTAVNTMRAAELTDEPQYLGYLRKATQRTERTRLNFGRPMKDRLFQSIYNHPIDSRNCDGCSADWEEIRSERGDGNPQAHYGIIASENTVIKYSETRERLRLETGALCFEMEAAGLMLDFPCIVIRGVCDYADSHKNKEWQGYAALVAASYSKELLGYVPVGQISQQMLAMDICVSILNDIKDNSERLDRIHDQQTQHHRELEARALTDQQRRCHRLFKVVNYVEQKNINPKRVQGTCEWAFKGSEYIHWSENNGPGKELLWISADPGCGKSVLARSIIDDLEAFGAVTVCYFFFKDNDEQNHLAGALCSMLHQVFSQRPHLLPYATPAWETNGDKLCEDVDELWRIFLTATLAHSPHKTICIFDALDECRKIEQPRLIEKLQTIYPYRPPRSSKEAVSGCLKFLFTSRPYDYIESHFQHTIHSRSFSNLRLKGEADNDQIRKEIDLVVRTRVKEVVSAACLSSDIRGRLEQQLLQMEHRTYLWLHLAMNDIRDTFHNSLRPAEESIQLIPLSVTAAYEKILTGVPSSQTATVRKILKIIVGPRRPLTVEEMAVMLGIAVSPDSRLVKDATVDPTGLDSKIRRLCGLFVFVENSRIYLIHQTAKEFLTQSLTRPNHEVNPIYPFSLRETHGQISEICIKYLLMRDLRHQGSNAGPGGDVTSLLRYSAENWADHVRMASPTLHSEVDTLLLSIYDTSRTNFAIWFPIFWKRMMRHHEKPIFLAIHLAAFNGHGQIVRKLVAEDKLCVNVIDGTNSHGLIWASRNGHTDVVKTLLEAKSNLNTLGSRFGTALYAASSKGHEGAVRLLLDWGAEVNAKCKGYSNVKRTAPGESYEELLQSIHTREAQFHQEKLQLHMSSTRPPETRQPEIRDDDIVQVDLPPGEYTNALYAASSKGHTAIVRMLLKKGADVNAGGGLCGSALKGACTEGHDKTVSMLLKWGADPNSHGLVTSPLYIAAAKGHKKIVTQLIRYGAEINAILDLYGTALLGACSSGHEKTVQLLLKRGAKVNIEVPFSKYTIGANYQTPLQAASSTRNEAIVRILLQKGAHVNAGGEICGSALQEACAEGHSHIVAILLQHGADPNHQGLFGNPLYVAVAKGHKNIALQLMEHGANAHVPVAFHGTALQAACSRGSEDIVRMLLKHGANANLETRFSQDCFGVQNGTGLQYAFSRGNEMTVRTQLRYLYRADIDTSNMFSKDPIGVKNSHTLRSVSSRGNGAISQRLAQLPRLLWHQYGAGLNVPSLLFKNQDLNDIQTAHELTLQEAFSGGHDKIVQLLLRYGADINIRGQISKDLFGVRNATALQVSCSGGFESIVQVLLDHCADVNSQGGQHGTALQVACSKGYQKIAEMLLEHGADVNANGPFSKDAFGVKYETALQVACSEGHEIIVQMLLDHAADINIQGGKHGTALQAACSGGHGNIVQLLLKNGADVNIRGGAYPAALQVARFRGHDEIVQTLLEYGAEADVWHGDEFDTFECTL